MSKWNEYIVKHKHIDIKMTTDASNTAWGAWIPKHQAQGFWNKRMSYLHSNCRELYAVWLGLISLKPFLENKTMQILSDNITTIAFINKQGGSTQQLEEHSETCTSRSHRYECITSGLISFGSTELESRPVVGPKLDVRMETPSKFVRNVGSVLGPSS